MKQQLVSSGGLLRLQSVDIEAAYTCLKQLVSGSGLGRFVGRLGETSIREAGCVVRSLKLESQLRLVIDLCILETYKGYLSLVLDLIRSDGRGGGIKENTNDSAYV